MIADIKRKVVESLNFQVKYHPEEEGVIQTFPSMGREGAVAGFTRDNDGQALLAIITPSESKGRWRYVIELPNGKELCHGELSLELHKTLDSIIGAVTHAFKGARTQPLPHHHA